MRTHDIGAALAAAALAVAILGAEGAVAGPEAGAKAFAACAACHSLVPGRHMTGPSLAGMLGRAAATAPGFRRYSAALRDSGLVWDEATLHAWLANPQALVPGNGMRVRGIEQARTRDDIIAFLRQAEADGGGMGTPAMPDLKSLGAEHQVTGLRYCADTYIVTTADGHGTLFWEFNLRFKTDSSDLGPAPGHPVLLSASMMGDRAFVIFADPDEISAHIEKRC